MFTNFGSKANRTISAVAAVVVVGLSGLAMARGDAGALPQGRVEVGELVPLVASAAPVATLPELVVSAGRLAPQPAAFAGELPRLSELVVVGQRELSVAAAEREAIPPRG